MTKDKTEAIKEYVPEPKAKEIVKTCSCIQSRSPKCKIHGDPDKI